MLSGRTLHDFYIKRVFFDKLHDVGVFQSQLNGVMVTHATLVAGGYLYEQAFG